MNCFVPLFIDAWGMLHVATTDADGSGESLVLIAFETIEEILDTLPEGTPEKGQMQIFPFETLEEAANHLMDLGLEFGGIRCGNALLASPEVEARLLAAGDIVPVVTLRVLPEG